MFFKKREAHHVSNEAIHPSSLGVEEIIATLSVLILASIFIGYYLWPDAEPTLESSTAVSAAAMTPVPAIASSNELVETRSTDQSQSISVSGEGQTGSRVAIEINGDNGGQTTVDSAGKWAMTADLKPSESIEIEINASAARGAPTTAPSEIAQAEIDQVEDVAPQASSEPVASTEPVSTSTALVDDSESGFADLNDLNHAPEQAPVQTAMVTDEATPNEAEPETLVDITKGMDITEPVITYLDRDRTTNELIISGSAPEAETHVVLLINGITTNPVEIGTENKWRYRFKAGPGEYYVRVTPATAKGSIIRADALPTLYNISLAPVTQDSTEAGAEISLLPGDFMRVEAGENLFQISQKTSIKVSDLMLVNGIKDEKSLKAGDVLFIPTGQ